MPSLFSKIRGKDGQAKAKNKKGNADDSTLQLPTRHRWEDAYIRTSIEPEEAQDLVRRCTSELKARALDHPFLLLPFRPTSDPSAVRTFIRHFFNGDQPLQGEALAQELRMIEPMVISGVLKWCWSRLSGGIVGWDAYELFKVGESDSNMARDSFSTFIPLSVENQAKSQIIFDYFDLLSAIAAHGKMNGFGGRKLSRMAAWWAFEHKDLGAGFDGGYKAWLSAADATSHLFFAYLRSLSPSQARAGITMLPMSLQKLLQETEYPPQLPSLMQSSTHRVVMIVETVSPTPFSLLRRANHFQYREDDRALHEYSEYEDPVEALTEECQRVLKAISLANQSQVSSSKHSTGLRDASWSRFEDIGFSGTLEEEEEEETAMNNRAREFARGGLRSTPASGTITGLDRPTTPSWADFLSSGFVDDSNNGTRNFLLPPDKVLPPIETNSRQRSSQSARPRLESDRNLEPGELASITSFDLDDAFWWVWMSSLAPEETAERKSAFGRCAVIETVIRSGRWLVMEEIIKGAAAEPDDGAYIAEKKGFFSWTRRSKTVSRRNKTLTKGEAARADSAMGMSASKASIGPDQQAKIQAAAQQLHAKEIREKELAATVPVRRGRTDAELLGDKTNSVMTLQPAVRSAASPAMKWANKYDKDAIREAYLANNNLGRGSELDLQAVANGHASEHNGRSAIPEKPLPSPVPVVQEVRPEPEQRTEPERPVEPASDLQPNDRLGATGRNSPLPPVPKEHEEALEAREAMMSPEPEAGAGGKAHKKLHKDEKKQGGGGFRKLFGRKNRQSKLPENAAGDVNMMLAQNEAQRSAAATPVPPAAPTAQEPPAPVAKAPTPQPPVERELTPSPPESIIENIEPTFEPPMHDNISRVDTADAAEAKEEFSRFDQGPLTDQPAFVPGDDFTDDEDDATPPPIARRSPAIPQQRPASEDSIEGSAVPPAIDRWAQIRKNAAERAARQNEEQSAPVASKPTDDNDDDTSGEETIESRVARIKARVAELTGNMEGTNGPGQVPYRQPPPLRR
ncbi:uncharacterized protein B0I36DRAFT_247473 [Microdochium trichocladiopsis]|uniref:Meiotically up-regulated protein Msb1/Mug8 domain-containing protein n=1 Tax=Microdochium trichocladiopsis TaxID=1682393 RepID=A0A9P9BRM5_9PEZI|nr:uncharacterized protein B0I36DRAFT_247473 [Microdochium trichocladiopsis]KAH7027430.1 hypothetical protein B0I36DRAFT_247473 [Microdochium trichocladiopsis]